MPGTILPPLAQSAAADIASPIVTETVDAKHNKQTRYDITSGVSVQGEIEENDDSDWYRLDLAAGETVQITLTPDRRDDSYGLYDPGLTLRDEDGKIIEVQDQNGDDDDGLPNDETLNFTSDTGGTYYIQVDGSSDVDIGLYELTVNPVDPDPLKVNKTATGTLGPGGYIDYYEVNLKANRAYTFDVQPYGADPAPSLELTLLAADFYPYSNGFGKLGLAPADVERTVMVAVATDPSYSGYKSGSYSLTVSPEVDDGLNSVLTLAVGEAAEDSLLYSDDTDFWHTDLMAGVTYALQMTGGWYYGFDRDVYIIPARPVIRDAAGNEVAAGSIISDEFPTYGDATVYFTAPEDGSYTIEADLDAFIGRNDYDYDIALNEQATTGDGDDIVFGDGDANAILTGGGRDDIDAGDGGDVVLAGDLSDTVLGGKGDDTILGEGGPDSLKGGQGADSLSGGEGADTLRGGNDNDILFGGQGSDWMTGDDGDDWMHGEGGHDTLSGGTGQDTLKGGGGDDDLSGDDGNDNLNGSGGDDLLRGGAGMDTLTGAGGNDSIEGGDDEDLIAGVADRDSITGGNGCDTIDGGRGVDRIDGGDGDDLLTGGAHRDIFVVSAGSDVITDFDLTEDELRFDPSWAADPMPYVSDLLDTASVVGADVVFSDGAGNTLTLLGVSDLAALEDALSFV